MAIDTIIGEYGAANLAISNLEKEVFHLHEELGKGTCQDYATYREKCGQIRGLLTAKRELLDALAKIEL